MTSSIIEESCPRMLIPCQAEGNLRVVRLRVLPGPVPFDICIKGLGEHTAGIPSQFSRQQGDRSTGECAG